MVLAFNAWGRDEIVTERQPARHAHANRSFRVDRNAVAALLPLTVLALLLLGYHPYAEDGGIYAAAAAAKADAALFPADRALVTGHTAYSIFTTLVGTASRATQASTDVILLLIDCAGLAMLVFAAMHLAESCFASALGPKLGAGIAVAIGAGLPVAGTALYAVDPYTTARTLTTPLLLLALSMTLRQRWTAAMALWLACVALHPLMALWSGVLLLLVLAEQHRRTAPGFARTATATIALGAFGLALAVPHWAPAETTVTQQLALTRAYWFPAEWRWYEWFGALAPPALLILIARKERASRAADRGPVEIVSAAATSATLLSICLAVCFAREHSHSLLLARLQILRVLQPVFVAFLAVAGGWVAARATSRAARTAVITTVVAAAVGCFAAQRSYYPHTRHIEWPFTDSGNAWEQAFLWCRDHTGRDALFALDADYINAPAEDAHGFRAVAHRSALPDGVKDAGVAAVLPRFATEWKAGVDASRGLNVATDSERRRRLQPLRVQWLVLTASAPTALACPYRNTAAKLCLLR